MQTQTSDPAPPQIALRRYGYHSAAPDGWQGNWQLPCVVDLWGVPRGAVARAVPDGRLTGSIITGEYKPTATNVAGAARAIAAALARSTSHDALVDRYREALDDPSAMTDAIQRWAGRPHPLAIHAPMVVRSVRAAEATLRLAADLWDDTCTTGTIRTAETGYAVFAGAQGFHTLHGKADALDAAIDLAYRLVLRTREDVLLRLVEALPGWDETTPVAGTTLSKLKDEPVVIYRSALLGEQVDAVPAVTLSAGGQRLSTVDVPWDDAAQRASLLAHREVDNANRYEATQAMFAELRARDDLPDLLTSKGTLNGKLVLTLRSGQSGKLAGAIRRNANGALAVALLPAGNAGKSTWVPVEQIVRASSVTAEASSPRLPAATAGNVRGES